MPNPTPPPRPVDLMFDHPEDSQDIRDARRRIIDEVRRWVAEARPAGGGQRGRRGGPWPEAVVLAAA
jgi:hypothetical protein